MRLFKLRLPISRSVMVGSVLAILVLTAASVPLLLNQPRRPIERIKHVVVIFQENWSFDGQYGKFPGANGIANAGATMKQVDAAGVPYTTLPQPVNNSVDPPELDKRFPADLPVAPFDAGKYISPDAPTGDPTHRFYQNQYQINGGKMDKFVAWGNTGGLPMSYFDATNLPVGQLALKYTLADNFFQAAFGGSLLNHLWMICACTPRWPDAVQGMRIELDANGMITKDGAVTPDGYLVNNAFSVNHPRPAGYDDPDALVPNLDNPTIGDRLSAKGIDWAWYLGGWDDVRAGRRTNHPFTVFAPFAYFRNYADGTQAKERHIKDDNLFLKDLQQGTLPAVSYIKPDLNEHPGASLLMGQRHVADLVHSIQQSKYWDDVVIIITYDEDGGRWDHVPPPKIDRWGPGPRVPAIIISPYAKRGYVDHTLYDFTSILKLIETRWELEPLGTRDAAANDMTNALDLTSSPPPVTP